MEALQIIEGEITPGEGGIKLMRPADMNHKDFMLMQKAEWPDFHRIRIGPWKYDYHKTKEIDWWCNDQVKGRWFHSEGYEVYYFEDLNSAIHFKLRWFSEIAPQAN